LFGFTREPVAIVYNRAAFADRRLPQSRAELAGMIRDAPRFFQARVGTYDVGLSGVGYLFATQDATRDHQHFRLIESLGRAGTRVFCCTADMLDSTASGNLVLSYNLIASYAAARAALDDRIGIHFLDDYNLVLARTAFILRTAPNVPDAERFVRFLVSPEGQSVIARESGLSFALDTPTLGRKQFLDIRLGVGLLSYLDRMKKERFLTSWQAAMQP
jgi:ABC-type Fe3+ transport system substrate-binding protein